MSSVSFHHGAKAQGFIEVGNTRYPVMKVPSGAPTTVPTPPESAGLRGSSTFAGFLPTTVDLTPFQTEVRDQGGRDTCGTFATVAALEAAYKRKFNVTLALSPQYLNHVAQMMAGFGEPTPDLPARETWPGAIGGGGMGRPTAALRVGVGVPPATTLAYIPDNGYQEAQEGDSPKFSTLATQRSLNNFNLSAAARDYVFVPPKVVNTTMLPQQALAQARYRPTNIVFAPPSELGSVAWYKQQLSAGHEVIFEFHCCDGVPSGPGIPWKLPTGSGGGGDGHVMLMVGYDDAKHAFRVKNSWGKGFADAGYVWVDYNMVTQGAVYFAGFLDDVESPTRTWNASTNPQLFIGQWNIDFDGWKGVLDIYSLPQKPVVPSDESFLRLGTLFLDDARVFRVNGRIEGNRLDFWIDWSVPNQTVRATGPRQFTAYLFGNDPVSMSGSMIDPAGTTVGFQASKQRLAVGVPAPGPLGLKSYLGTWDANLDGIRGRFVFHTTASLPGFSGVVVGKYHAPSGVSIPASILVNLDPRKILLSISTSTPRQYEGFVNGHELGVLSATTTRSGMTTGMIATRR
jgi:hypothetical protein